MTSSTSPEPDLLDLLVVGGGMGGIAAVHEAVAHGLSVRGLEGGSGLGGVWFWNRYPGARCDTESLDYSFSFSPELDQEWSWTERYPTQPELEDYLNHVVDRFDLRRHFQLETLVTELEWEEQALRWRVTTSRGMYLARHVTLATGMLHHRVLPDYPGMETFAGESFHTAAWPADLDLTGKRVAVVGTGSSGIQVVGPVAEVAAELHVFQRSANYIIPAQQGRLDPDEYAEVKRTYPERRKQLRHANGGGLWLSGTGRSALDDTPEQRELEYGRAWGKGGFHFLVTYDDLTTNQAANDTAGEFLRRKLPSLVGKPELLPLLTPKPDVSVGIKRIGVDVGFYAAFDHDHVHLVDARATPITGITPTGISTTDRDIDVDVIVYATGFDAFTGSINQITIRGTGGRLLTDAWADGPRTWHGMMVAGFPNLFMICGPGGPNITANVPALSELEARWISDLVVAVRAEGAHAVDADADEQERWTAQVEADARQTLYASHDTWFNGANVAGKARVYPTYTRGATRYYDLIEDLAAAGYPGLHRLAAVVPADARAS
ncbi:MULTISPECIES: flavin-containing monooxygenase [unclassified Nocardioides]|uniref:flavin-containing monooxygenase n=1 Tax=unclassified Nocardioides TaxID=2615069 RepID=UPI0030157B5E